MKLAFLLSWVLSTACFALGQTSSAAQTAAAAQAASAVQTPATQGAQAVPTAVVQWQKSQSKDAFTSNESTEFRLEGKYLTAPSNVAASDPPAIVLRCKAEKHGHGSQKFEGKLEQAFLVVHTVVDAQVYRSSTVKVPVRYRLDDGKIHEEFLYPSTTYKALSLQPQFCGFCVVDDFLYGHQMAHKADSSPQIKKVLISLPEFLGSDVVIQFDMPDAREVADVCGVTYHK